MIKISFSLASILYLTISLAGIFSLWIYEGFKPRRQPKLTQQELLNCDYCGFSFLHETTQAFSKCPQCHILSPKEQK